MTLNLKIVNTAQKGTGKERRSGTSTYLVCKNGVILLFSNYARLEKETEVTVSKDDYLRTAQVFCQYSNKHLKEKVLPRQPGGGRVQPGMDTIGGNLCSDDGSI